MIDIPEKDASECMKLARNFVDHDDYEQLKSAIMMASPSGESQSESTALICHGRLLQSRDIFELLERIARPAPKPEKKGPTTKQATTKDPDLDDGDE